MCRGHPDRHARSAWLPLRVRPVRVGWYEARYWSVVSETYLEPVMRHWNGRAWEFSPGAGMCAFGNANDTWRGLASEGGK